MYTSLNIKTFLVTHLQDLGALWRQQDDATQPGDSIRPDTAAARGVQDRRPNHDGTVYGERQASDAADGHTADAAATAKTRLESAGGAHVMTTLWMYM